MRSPRGVRRDMGRRAISCHISGLACQRFAARAARRRRRWSAAPRSSIPLALRELDRGRFGLGPRHAAGAIGRCAAHQRQLFALPSMAPVRKALDDEFDRYIARHKAELPNESIGVGTAFDFQLFDRAQLYSPDTRFVLSGIVNRMDRAYVRRGRLRRGQADLPADADRRARDDRRGRGLAATADDAERGAEGQGRSAVDGSGKPSPAPRSRGAGSPPAICR